MNSKRRILLEVPIETLDEARAAAAAGADRLELCALLEHGGVSPSIETLEEFGRSSPLPFVVMVRPRAGNFRYGPDEVDAMEAEIELALIHGAAGVAFGGLTDGDGIDAALCERLMGSTVGAESVFHRAFDEVVDPFAALDQLTDLGFTRVLTSGGRACAADAEAARRIQDLVDRAAGRIEILPGGGIRPHNVERLLRETCCTQIHSACRRIAPSDSTPVFEPQMLAELRHVIDRHDVDA